ncbi:MAG TPA: recombinase family protein [Lachnospiraceae bacterium]|nr:recombinase family protein [Lachnospiraceae bacterium]
MPKRKTAPKNELRAVGYIRVSTDMQVEEGCSLENQEYQIRNYVENQHMQLIEIYKEKRGASGKNIEAGINFMIHGVSDMIDIGKI